MVGKIVLVIFLCTALCNTGSGKQYTREYCVASCNQRVSTLFENVGSLLQAIFKASCESQCLVLPRETPVNGVVPLRNLVDVGSQVVPNIYGGDQSNFNDFVKPPAVITSSPVQVANVNSWARGVRDPRVVPVTSPVPMEAKFEECDNRCKDQFDNLKADPNHDHEFLVKVLLTCKRTCLSKQNLPNIESECEKWASDFGDKFVSHVSQEILDLLRKRARESCSSK